MTYLKPSEVTDRVMANKPITVEEVEDHFNGTIFWNYSDSVEKGLADPCRQEELAMQVFSSEKDEDNTIAHSVLFESGESRVGAAVVHEITHMDETAHKIDAEFIANLPVYVPALFREIYALRKKLAALTCDTEKGEGPPEPHVSMSCRVPAAPQAPSELSHRICNTFRGLTLSWPEVMHIVAAVEECASNQGPKPTTEHTVQFDFEFQMPQEPPFVERLETRMRHFKGLLLEICQKVGIDVAAKAFEEQVLNPAMSEFEEQALKSTNANGKTGLGRIKRFMQGIETSQPLALLRRFRDFEIEIRQECAGQSSQSSAADKYTGLYDLTVGDRFYREGELEIHVVTKTNGKEVYTRNEATGVEELFACVCEEGACPLKLIQVASQG